jgi:4,5-DOPA dioxygenase extradiol
MKRKSFLKTLAILPFAGYTMKLNQLDTLTGPLNNTDLMPVIFAGHGSPMNAIEQNEFSSKWQEMGKTLPHPAAILCISAHWETRGTLVTAMEKPKTIHDFGGFPQALFDVEYPAPGSPGLAKEASESATPQIIGMDQNWGLDHGAWSIIKNMYPKADVPVVQLSLDYQKDPGSHYELAQQLAGLRKKGVLILGSGNMVHNLRMLDWQKTEGGSDWAIEANSLFKRLILNNEHERLMDYKKLGSSVQLAIPTPEHFLPLLYALALKGKDDDISFFNDKAVMGSLTMTSVWIGKGA